MTKRKWFEMGGIAAGVVLILFGLLDRTKAESRDGGLIPVRPGSERGESADYRRLYESKLLVSPAEVACYVFLPASKRLEHVAAVYRAPQKEGSLPGGYWVTATPSARLSVVFRALQPSTSVLKPPRVILLQSKGMSLGSHMAPRRGSAKIFLLVASRCWRDLKTA